MNGPLESWAQRRPATRWPLVLLALLLLIGLGGGLTGCGGGSEPDDPCAEISTLTPGPVPLSDTMAPVATLAYSGAGSTVTLGGSFTLAGGHDVRVRLYDSFASTHYDQAVMARDGVVEIPPFTWTPSTAPRTLVLYASSATPATATHIVLSARRCQP
jgi:hypothetical protein